MAAHCLILFNSYILILFSLYIVAAAYKLTASESITDGQTLVSRGGKFKLGFFSPTTGSKYRYLGIWYNNISEQTIVWVANRDSPLNSTSGVLRIGNTGNIVIVNQTQGVIWSSNSSRAVETPILEFVESGNLVLRDERDEDPESYLWQSFDYPTQTLLPGMKLGLILKTGNNICASSWKSSDDPSSGNFTFGMDGTGVLELYIRKGSQKIYRSGPWNGIQNSGSPDLKPNSFFIVEVVQNTEEVYYTYRLVNQSSLFRMTLTQTGSDVRLQRFTWVERTNGWMLLVSVPRDRCDDYALCGIYSTCDVSFGTLCRCLQGFRPKSPQRWSQNDWTEGCEREAALNCSQGEGFRKYTGMKLPETTGSWVNRSMTLEECRVECLKNCSCIAYSNLRVYSGGGGSGCLLWSLDLIDIRQLSDGGQDLYIKMPASELDSEAHSRTKGMVVVIVSIITSVAAIIFLALGSWCIWKNRTLKGGGETDDFELPLFDLITLRSATNNFSEENKLGEGGFGPVYKGNLRGQEIAVKRLAKDSIQGVKEFRSEVILISKLQHKNLVKLLGCCIKGEEKMLVYEYMQNQSLDISIFDTTKSRLLDWAKRFDIILGIARGLLYLHHDSRLKIIHRDLKASNVLLDGEMIPKIADFGLARIFQGDQIDARTKRIVGTYGYMSPEYVFDGRFSVKSDVFSFGVLVLEIISGKKNRTFNDSKHGLNLLGHAWRLWKDGSSMELIDNELMRNSCCFGAVLRCIHIGLLCVQSSTDCRPTMSSVVLMLSSESLVLPTPQQPGFYIERSRSNIKNSSSTEKEIYTSNNVTITNVEGR
ncbi:hypothetical protein ACHQM5_012515 [Ranunculus cassubicifolius]